MHPKQANKTKRAPNADRSFPWRCRHCGKQEVVMATSEYQAEVRHDGRLHTFTIPDLKLPICRACGEKVFTEDVDCQVNDALRSHLKLLTPAQIHEGVKRVGMSQKQFANCLGVAEATLSRWLNETQIQSRAMDNLLRTFLAFPQVRTMLCGENQDPQLGTSEVTSGNNPGPARRVNNPHDVANRSLTKATWPEATNEKRDACRPAQRIVEQTGTTWGRRCVR